MKKKVLNISFVEYANLTDRSEYDFILRYAKLEPADHLKIGSFDENTFGFVKDIQDLMNTTGLNWETFFDEMNKRTGIDLQTLAKKPLFDLQSQRLFIKQQVDMINTLESTQLGHTASPDEEQAGLDVFKKYRAFCQFDKLMTLWPQYKLDEVRALPYSLCFTKLMYESDKMEFEKALHKLRSMRQ